jgi:hypothetical protein
MISWLGINDQASWMKQRTSSLLLGPQEQILCKRDSNHDTESRAMDRYKTRMCYFTVDCPVPDVVVVG